MINKNLIKKIGSPKIFVFTVIWLMVLVFVGTIVQKNIGLYAAQQQYFSSWFKFLGPVPLPSGKLTMLIIFLNLSCYFFRPHIFTINKIGITITHTGVLMMILGVLKTSLIAVKVQMVNLILQNVHNPDKLQLIILQNNQNIFLKIFQD